MPAPDTHLSQPCRLRHNQLFQDFGCCPFALVDQAEQDVLSANEAVVEKPRLFLGQDEDPAGAVSKRLERRVKCDTDPLFQLRCR